MFGTLTVPELGVGVRAVGPVELTGRSVPGAALGDIAHRLAETLSAARVLRSPVGVAAVLTASLPLPSGLTGVVHRLLSALITALIIGKSSLAALSLLALLLSLLVPLSLLIALPALLITVPGLLGPSALLGLPASVMLLVLLVVRSLLLTVLLV